MDSRQLDKQPQQKRQRGRPRKNPLTSPLRPENGQRSTNTPSSAPEHGFSTSIELKRKRGRSRKSGDSPPPKAGETFTKPTTPASTSNKEGSKERPIRTFHNVPKGSFSGLRSSDRTSFTLREIKKIQGDPEEPVYLTDDDEEFDDTTDVEEGGFDEAMKRSKRVADAKTARKEASEELYKSL
ncbi:uncharacterized protein K460DRAFT_400714 [Cucurbitaria berberidis CBS 394.84]|uniref:Uncharacterized protein n=1 Tax=Cucurbitaria berberidis CBS 394.84 TaxID=1168544 RepID=A0A9P4GQ66_9PLEO|nr:uncharacterized protein K460DRAFT_400714 [Cucurbitaria berberidis CBS 394.84]KAF1850668.1 hypothetical protein K460DRAFT_400714 [Cucurbitaria berberidis CBS 394.84]